MLLFITILHVMLSITLILIILLQPGKDQGSVFGGGGGGNKMYGPRGQANALGRATTIVAVMFMLTSISLAWYSTEQVRDGSDIEGVLESLDNEDEDGFYNPAEDEASGFNPGPTGGLELSPPPTGLGTPTDEAESVNVLPEDNQQTDPLAEPLETTNSDAGDQGTE